MKVVVVTEFVGAGENSTGYYWSSIVDGLVASGRKVLVVTTRSSAAAAAQRLGVDYVTVDSPAYTRSSLYSRVRGLLAASWRLFGAARKATAPGDTLLSGTNPAFLLLLLALLRTVRRFCWVLLVHDVFPENLIPAGLARKSSLRYRLTKFLFDAGYRRADALIAIGRDMIEVLGQKTRRPQAIHFVPNWVDLESLPAGPPSASRDPARITFQYFGNLGRLQGLDQVLAAVSRVQRRDAAFTIVGAGAMRESVQAYIQDHPEIDIRLCAAVPMNRNHEVLTDCDVAIVSLAPGMKGLGVPSKAYFSMAAGKPLLMVLDEGCELHRMWAEHPQTGWFCRSGDTAALVQLLDSIDPADVQRRREQVRRLVEQEYSARRAHARIENVLAAAEAQCR